MNPNHDEKYKEGWDAYYNDLNRTDCPYKPIHCSNAISWFDGYMDALMIDMRVESESFGMGNE